ncbi:hypothetical protein [Nitrosomonas oligotropha]|nr:hypothetical protein [Nitrosomonas oligotropha]
MAALLTRESVVHTKLRSTGYVLGVFFDGGVRFGKYRFGKYKYAVYPEVF